MIKRIVSVALPLVILVGSPALAQCGKQSAKDEAGCSAAAQKGCCPKDLKTLASDGKTCSKDAKTCCASAKGGQAGGCGGANCAGELARYKGLALPRMAYQVNDKRTTCRMSAKKMAKAENAEIEYVVADETYTDKSKALKAHARVLDEFLDDMLTIKYAVGNASTGYLESAEALARKKGEPISYRLALFSFQDRESVEKAAKLARAATEKTSMKMMVGDEAFGCPVHAADAAKTQGKEIEYCVGQLTTTSEAAAQVQLAKERIKAALVACEESGGKQVSDA